MPRGDKAAVIYGGGVISGAVAPAFARAEGPVEQIAEALPRDVAPVTGKCRRSATISWRTPPWPGSLSDPSHETGGAPPRAEG